MRTDCSFKTCVSGTPDRLPQLLITDIFLRQTQGVTHSLCLPPDRGGNSDQLGLDVLKRFEFQHRLGKHPEISGQLVLVYREDAEALTRTRDFQRIPDPGGGIDLDVYFKRSTRDPPAFFKHIQTLACVFDVLGPVYPLQYDSRNPGEHCRFEFGCRGVTVDPDKNFGAALSRLVYGRRHPGLQVFLPVPARLFSKSRIIASAHEA